MTKLWKISLEELAKVNDNRNYKVSLKLQTVDAFRPSVETFVIRPADITKRMPLKRLFEKKFIEAVRKLLHSDMEWKEAKRRPNPLRNVTETRE